MSRPVAGEREVGASTTSRFAGLARKGQNAPWRYIVSIVCILFLWTGLGGLLYIVPGTLAENDGDPSTYVNGQTFEVVGYPIAEFAALTLGFGFVWVGLFIAIRYIHRRPFLTLVTGYRRVRWRRVWRGFWIYLLLAAVAFSISYLLNSEDFRLVIEPRTLLVFVAVVMALVPVQAAAEELLFRGYLLQLFGLATSNVLILSLTSGALFVLPHLGNPEMPAVDEGFWIACINFAVFGFLMAAVTLKDGGIELAVGAHVANNVFAFPMVNFNETLLDTPSVFELLDTTLTYTDLAYTIAVSVAFYLLVFRVFDHKHKTENSVSESL